MQDQPSDGRLEVRLDGAASGQRFQGIGAASGGGATSRFLIDYPPAQRAEILDYLFKPQYGASLQLLKVEIGSDGNSTEGAEATHARTPQERNFERGYEWWIMQEAKRRNPAIQLIALAWNFPAWVGQANSQATADYLVSYLEGARSAHHLDIDYIGIWNETHMDVAFIKTLRKTLDAHGLKTKIMADDSVNSWDIVTAMDADPQLKSSIDVIATHYPRWLSPPLAQKKSAEWGLPLWSSEDGPWGDEWGTGGQQSPPLAQLLNRNYIIGRMTSTNIWNLVTAYSDAFELPNAGLLRAKTPWSGHYEVTSPLWVVAHTTQFAAPGWRYLDGASRELPGTGSLVALHDGERYSVVIETLDAVAPRPLRLRLVGGLGTGSVAVWHSDAHHWFEQLAPLEPRDGMVDFTLEPNSVYTLTNTTGQHKGAAAPAVDTPFPVPFRDEFESDTANHTPRYWFEANGAFETAPCDMGRRGRCLWQMTHVAPIGWSYYGAWPKAGTLATVGDVRWRDYRVAADVRLSDSGYAALFGRVARVTSDGVIDAYQLRLYGDGRWELRASTADAPLRSGRVAGSGPRWRHVELSFDGQRIGATLDGRALATVTDRRLGAGLAGVGDGWNGVSFDNFTIEPLRRGRPVIAAAPPQPVSAVPAAPELFVPQSADHMVRLSWKVLSDAVNYRVTIGTQPEIVDKSDDVGNVSSYTFRTLTNGVKYYFTVSGVNGLGAGKASPVQYAVPAAASGAP